MPSEKAKYNTVEIKRSFPENKAGYRVHEVLVDGKVYYAACSQSGTWKVCDTREVMQRSRNLALLIDGRNCGIHLISLIDRMLQANSTHWQGPLPRILG